MSDGYAKTRLASGLTVVTERMPDRQSVSLGVWLRNGARDEPAGVLGVSHLIEHMMFKGTERRDARAIAESLESLGGHLDAFTGREQVCYYARALSEHLPEVVDVLSDIVCHSRFAETDVVRERGVVREEILAAEDNPDDKVSELLAGQVWAGHPLGLPILGTVESLEGIGPNELMQYFGSRYRPESLVIAATGGLDHLRLCELAEASFDAPSGPPLPLSEPPELFRPTVRHEVRDDLQQLYLSLATRGISYSDEDRFGLVILSTLLGGGMSSRLFQSVREEAGLAYSVFSAADFHRDTGLLSIHLGVSPERGREALARVREELLALVEHGPTEAEVLSARAQLKGSVIIGQESVSSRMYHLAHEELYRGTTTTIEEEVAAIDAVSSEQVMTLARRFLRPESYALTVLGPKTGGAIGEADWPVASGALAA